MSLKMGLQKSYFSRQWSESSVIISYVLSKLWSPINSLTEFLVAKEKHISHLKKWTGLDRQRGKAERDEAVTFTDQNMETYRDKN